MLVVKGGPVGARKRAIGCKPAASASIALVCFAGMDRYGLFKVMFQRGTLPTSQNKYFVFGGMGGRESAIPRGVLSEARSHMRQTKATVTDAPKTRP